MSDFEDKLLTYNETCKRYKVNRITIRRWCSRKSIGFPPMIIIGGKNYFRLRDLLAFEAVSERRVAS